jgi:photosystem II stability/assembly factor-like uncharacterized protein
MRIPYLAFSVTSLVFFNFLGSMLNLAEAKNAIDLLQLPAKKSELASHSVLMAIKPLNNTILAVGERGHIINWQSKTEWQQQESPVSVSITDVSVLSDGSKIAVGHDGIILKAESQSSTWRKVFTGVKLTQFKIKLLQRQYKAIEQVIKRTQDEDELEELEYQRDDLAFAIEDNQIELQSGPNKPLLSIIQTSNDLLFASGAYGALITSKDKGETWHLISDRLDNPDNFHLNSIAVAADDKLYIVGENGMGFTSEDLGKTWSSMTLPYAGSLFGIITHPINETSSDSNTQLAAFGLQGNLIISLDGGAHWQHKKLPTSASLLGGTFSKQGNAYLVGHGGLIVNFKPENLETLRMERHPSGATLASVLVKENTLILAGQFGISTWPLKL